MRKSRKLIISTLVTSPTRSGLPSRLLSRPDTGTSTRKSSKTLRSSRRLCETGAMRLRSSALGLRLDTVAAPLTLREKLTRPVSISSLFITSFLPPRSLGRDPARFYTSPLIARLLLPARSVSRFIYPPIKISVIQRPGLRQRGRGR